METRVTHRYPVTITIHDIIDRSAGIIGPGRAAGRSGSFANARKALSKHLQGCLTAGPSNVAHVVNEATGEDHGWWFSGMKAGVNGRDITLWLVPIEHKGEPLTIRQ